MIEIVSAMPATCFSKGIQNDQLLLEPVFVFRALGQPCDTKEYVPN